jgi:hypothetical protein
MLEFSHEGSEKIHVDVFTELVEHKPIADVAFCHYNFDSFSGKFVIGISNSG